MVVLIGSGHVTYGLGSERQTAPYYDGKIASVIPVPTKLIQVSEESVAERAGLVVGDVLLSIDGQPLDSAETLCKVFAPYRWGDVAFRVIDQAPTVAVFVRGAIAKSSLDTTAGQ